MWFRVAKELGRTVAEAKRSMSFREFVMWCAFMLHEAKALADAQGEPGRDAQSGQGNRVWKETTDEGMKKLFTAFASRHNESVRRREALGGNGNTSGIG